MTGCVGADLLQMALDFLDLLNGCVLSKVCSGSWWVRRAASYFHTRPIANIHSYTLEKWMAQVGMERAFAGSA